MFLDYVNPFLSPITGHQLTYVLVSAVLVICLGIFLRVLLESYGERRARSQAILAPFPSSSSGTYGRPDRFAADGIPVLDYSNELWAENPAMAGPTDTLRMACEALLWKNGRWQARFIILVQPFCEVAVQKCYATRLAVLAGEEPLEEFSMTDYAAAKPDRDDYRSWCPTKWDILVWSLSPKDTTSSREMVYFRARFDLIGSSLVRLEIFDKCSKREARTYLFATGSDRDVLLFKQENYLWTGRKRHRGQGIYVAHTLILEDGSNGEADRLDTSRLIGARVITVQGVDVWQMSCEDVRSLMVNRGEEPLEVTVIEHDEGYDEQYEEAKKAQSEDLRTKDKDNYAVNRAKLTRFAQLFQL
ncbi:hypothetical protein BV898_01317 [Hypsibius exemplaris]|uniref:Uncharacterized protein n=1 Tax=Hypsibius exemplaris TaxID=2072580 RepID=A0A1W0XB26_HYPEX|nr:hypothetical protein BV898_01317 [Hypsibius exemplaris]